MKRLPSALARGALATVSLACMLAAPPASAQSSLCSALAQVMDQFVADRRGAMLRSGPGESDEEGGMDYDGTVPVIGNCTLSDAAGGVRYSCSQRDGTEAQRAQFIAEFNRCGFQTRGAPNNWSMNRSYTSNTTQYEVIHDGNLFEVGFRHMRSRSGSERLTIAVKRK